MRHWVTLLIAAFITLTIRAEGLKVLFIGDSVTDGNWGGGGAKPSSERNHQDMNHIHGHGFMFLCAAHYMGAYPANEYKFYNRGISGNTLYDLEKRWKEDVIDIKPDVLSILVGINDVYKYQQSGDKRPFDFITWEKTYRKLLDKARSNNPKLKLLIASPFVAPVGQLQNDTVFNKYNEMIHRCSVIVQKIAQDYNATYLPYQEMFALLIKNAPSSQNTYWIWDGIHPTTAGHQRMADIWIKKADNENILKKE